MVVVCGGGGCGGSGVDACGILQLDILKVQVFFFFPIIFNSLPYVPIYHIN